MRKTILIVEDEIVLQDVYKLVLSLKGYEVHTANNGVEGLIKAKETKPDMILLDLFMPVMDGREFLRNIDNELYPDTKIVVYTNHSDGDIQEEMLGLGAYKYVLKSSMSPQDLLAMTAEVINS